jgi:AraC-like DNA-binding protein
MEEKPSYWKTKLNPAFPFVLWDKDFEPDSSNCTFPLHWQCYQEIFYIVQGSLTVFLDGRSYDGRAGDIFIVDSEMIHGYFDSSPDCRHIVFLFGLEIFDQSLVELWEDTDKGVVFNRKRRIRPAEDGAFHKRLSTLIKAMSAEYFGQKKGYRLAIKKHLCDMGLLFLRELPPGTASVKNTKRSGYRGILERVLTYMYENYQNPGITLESAAHEASLSPTYFSRLFRERTGQTFHAYLARLRINRALDYLSETEMLITDIAFNCGFSNIKTFNRVFKTYTGASPSSYRR